MALLISITFSPFCKMENSLFRNLHRKRYIDKNQFDEYLKFPLYHYSFRSLLLLFPRNEVSCMLYEDFPLSINACIVDAGADNHDFLCQAALECTVYFVGQRSVNTIAIFQIWSQFIAKLQNLYDSCRVQWIPRTSNNTMISNSLAISICISVTVK